MVRERRLVPIEEDALLKKARAKMAELGAKTFTAPTDAEWSAFEDLYFELKDLVRYSPDAGQKYNSLSDLAMLAWGLKSGTFKQSAEDPIVFVTENASILAASGAIAARLGITVASLDYIQNMTKEGAQKPPRPNDGGRTGCS